MSGPGIPSRGADDRSAPDDGRRFVAEPTRQTPSRPEPERARRPTPRGPLVLRLAFCYVALAMIALLAGAWIRHADHGAADPGAPDLDAVATQPPQLTAEAIPDDVASSAAVQPPPVFLHPGVGVDLDQLEFVRAQVVAGRQPWREAYDGMRTSPYAALDWQPRPREVVECGLFSQPDNGCTDESRDALAAYTQALLWYLTQRPEHAEKATEIIDAWSAVLRDHTNANAPLQAGWTAVPLVGAAELMRYTYDDWPAANVDRAAQMFHDVFLPKVAGGAPRTEGNWDLTALDGAASIAVFLDDKPLFDQVVDRWRARVPAYIYLSSDGPLPADPPGGIPGNDSLVTYWHGQSTFVDGLAQETCRDLGHTGWGIEAMSQLAETARIQGLDLFGEIQQRLASALEFHAGVQLNGAPAWLCGGTVTAEFYPAPEIAYTALVNRGISLPSTQRLLEQERPQDPTHFFAWETLTHAGNPY